MIAAAKKKRRECGDGHGGFQLHPPAVAYASIEIKINRKVIIKNKKNKKTRKSAHSASDRSPRLVRGTGCLASCGGETRPGQDVRRRKGDDSDGGNDDEEDNETMSRPLRHAYTRVTYSEDTLVGMFMHLPVCESPSPPAFAPEHFDIKQKSSGVGWLRMRYQISSSPTRYITESYMHSYMQLSFCLPLYRLSYSN
ncbi:hypothetical protein MGYG_00854 [Nannizzia gypsea CBS 118893]|uniref:Uncharacterized protein n=1 Tax=Arthroderma gypseum (strain ATCC MYA-4604 / CBS 118893) TaxID=535722 RepID=E5R2E2_ARTGP|nr:hypothetical protein MGYG_00854 [Nannizzia gypsea CBS 118893]EFQ97818.1 hypothetical protein MGYG_00854 [Nannizzia gypsea CBS 118893]